MSFTSEYQFEVLTSGSRSVWAVYDKHEEGQELLAYIYGGAQMAQDFVEFLNKKNKRRVNEL